MPQPCPLPWQIAGFIFGDNVEAGGSGNAKVAMTSPVVYEGRAEKIAMTSPVVSEASRDGKQKVRI
jgi:hypothetical protein